MSESLAKLQNLWMDALFDQEALQTALRAFATFCDAPLSHLMFADGARNLLRSTFSESVDPFLVRAEPEYQHINPRVKAIPMMKEGRATRDKDFISYDDIARDQTYQELILPFGLGHFSGVPIINSSRLTAGVALHRPMQEDAFTDDEASRHEAAAAACAPVFHLAELIESGSARQTLDVLNQNGSNAVIDASATIREHTAGFERLTRRGLFRLSANKSLSFHDEAANKALQSALDRRRSVVGGQFLVRSPRTAEVWICKVLPVPPVSALGSMNARALLSIKPVTTKACLDLPLIREAFGLTPSEASVAELLCQGLGAQEISAQRNVQVSTTRSMIKHILQKTECRRQVELVALLRPFIQSARGDT